MIEVFNALSRHSGRKNVPRRWAMRRVLRLVGWNATWLIVGLGLLGLMAEAWLRSVTPFRDTSRSTVFHSHIGQQLAPDVEVRWTNYFDYYTISRTNSLGFLDQEPPSPERAKESCHIAIIGDSYVEALEVPIADKFQVQLEKFAARQLPHLDVTTSAFGVRGMAQINQLPLYDEYARHLHPKLLVLVFVPNDYPGNFPLWTALVWGVHPRHQMWVSAMRAKEGGFRLRAPDPLYQQFQLPRFADLPTTPSWQLLIEQAILRHSLLFDVLGRKYGLYFTKPDNGLDYRTGWLELLRRDPAYAPLLEAWHPLHPSENGAMNEDNTSYRLLVEGQGSRFYDEALAFTAFSLDEFKKRAERDGVELVILASHLNARYGGVSLAVLKELAKMRRIPVIDQSDFIRRQGAMWTDAQWPHDPHWSPLGHRWAAQALLQHLKRNQWICDKDRGAAEAARMPDAMPIPKLPQAASF